MKAEQLLNKGSLSLPQGIELLIFKFLKLEEQLSVIPLICRDFSIAISKIYHKTLQREFSEYFQPNEIELVSAQDLRIILAIMMMHRRFTAGIHLHNTPYYLSLIEQALDSFLLSKDQPIETFPWAAVVMGNLMRVKERKKAARYFKMAIHLPIAKTLMAITYSIQDLYIEKIKELKETELLETLKGTEQWPPSQFRIDQDFIIYHLIRVDKYHAVQLLFNAHPPESEAHFELLENNFRYLQILGRWEKFKKSLSKTKFQYVNELHDQMKEAKDPVLASHMAAGLLSVYFERFPTKTNETAEEIDRRINLAIEECIQKGGFDFSRTRCKDDQFIEISKQIHQEKIPVRSGFLAVCRLKMANVMAEVFLQKKKQVSQDQIISLMRIVYLFASAIMDGLPEAVLELNIFIDKLQFPPVELTRNPLEKSSQRLIFPIFFAAQQSIQWILNLYSNNSLTICQDKAKKNLTQYTEHKNGYVSASANMALGLLCAQEGNKEKAELCFDGARKDMSASTDYLDFAKRLGYRLPPSVAESKSFRIISQWTKSPDKSVDAESLTLNKRLG